MKVFSVNWLQIKKGEVDSKTQIVLKWGWKQQASSPQRQLQEAALPSGPSDQLGAQGSSLPQLLVFLHSRKEVVQVKKDTSQTKAKAVAESLEYCL